MAAKKKAKKTARKAAKKSKKTVGFINIFKSASKDKTYVAAKKRAKDAVKKAAVAYKNAIKKEKAKRK
jgi:hypothetical protein